MIESPVPYTASLDAPEASARRLVDFIGREEAFLERPVDLHEVAADRWSVIVYFETAPTEAEREALDHLSACAFGRGAPNFAVSEVPDADWVAQSLSTLSPVRTGRFVVHGSHDRAAPHPNEIGIEIDAAEAFGTGHHGTTAGCLMAIDRLARARPVRRAADIGTGSGVLAIAIAKRCKAAVTACDIDRKATVIAVANARINGVGGRIRTVNARGLDHRVFAERGPFDLVVANILAAPLTRLAPAVGRRLTPSAAVVLSGLLPGQKPRVVSAYRSQGLRLAGEIVLDGWLTLVLERGRC